jgi:hypothetical protein
MSGKVAETIANIDTVAKVRGVVEEMLKNPKNPNAYHGVMATMMGAKAMQGDLSVVRQPEMEIFQQAGDIVTKYMSIVNKAGTGDVLLPQQKEQLYKAVSDLERITTAGARRMAAPIINSAKRKQLPLEEIFPDFPGFLGVVGASQNSPNELDPLEAKKAKLAALKAKQAK